jgi:uncharacterized protein
MDLSAVDHGVAALAAFAAGTVNALAGGGTLITFPTLVALGVPARSSNVTNTVALCPGYFGGARAQSGELTGEAARLRPLAAAAGLGGLAGSVLLVTTSDDTFELVVPFLILLACGLLLFQDRMRGWIERHRPAGMRRSTVPVAVFTGGIYGGYFGAGLGIMFLAVLGVLIPEPMRKINAFKSLLTLVINTIAAAFFAFSGQVEWVLALVMAPAALAGGHLGGRLAGKVDPRVLRAIVVSAGLALAVTFWL